MARNLDWEAIGAEVRAGVLSLREIGRKHGVSDTSIRKWMARQGIERDLSTQVQQAARAKLVGLDGSQVRTLCARPASVRTANSAANPAAAETPAQMAAEQQIIDSAAETVVAVVSLHRRDIQCSRQLAMRLYAELDATTSHQGELTAQILAETEEDASGQRRSAMLKAIGLPSRAATLRDLTFSLRHLVGLERQAFNLDQPQNPASPSRPTLHIHRQPPPAGEAVEEGRP